MKITNYSNSKILDMFTKSYIINHESVNISSQKKKRFKFRPAHFFMMVFSGPTV